MSIQSVGHNFAIRFVTSGFNLSSLLEDIGRGWFQSLGRRLFTLLDETLHLWDQWIIYNLLTPNLEFPLKEDVEIVIGVDEVLDNEFKCI
jgi:hypothetical protein